MKRIIITGAALLAVAPVSLGLMGNASFAQSVPVRVPSQATVVGGQSTHAEPVDDKSGPSTQAEPGDDKSGPSTQAEPGDDKSGPSTQAEPGSGKSGPSTQVQSGSGKSGRMSTQTQATDDKVGTSGSGKVDDGGTVDVNGGRNDGAGHP